MSRTANIYAYLADGHALTAFTAAKKFGTLAMHSRAAELRARGHQIECLEVKRNGRRVWEYRLRQR